MRRPLLLPFAASLAIAAASAFDQTPQGYLDPGAFDLLRVLPAAPVRGDVRDQADRAIFVATRALQDKPRWALATSDVGTSPAQMMQDFSCAAGVALTPQDAPRLAALVVKAGVDTSNQTNAAKRYYQRLRPFLVDEGAVCQPKAQLADSFDYPSGHTTWGWTWATILAELAPDRATPILARGRAYGESRIVCGAHNQSAVEAGFISASATMAVVHAQAAFRADLAAARPSLRRCAAIQPRRSRRHAARRRRSSRRSSPRPRLPFPLVSTMSTTDRGEGHAFRPDRFASKPEGRADFLPPAIGMKG